LKRWEVRILTDSDLLEVEVDITTHIPLVVDYA
jgi:hypothetical protein